MKALEIIEREYLQIIKREKKRKALCDFLKFHVLVLRCCSPVYNTKRGRRGHDRMVVGFTMIYAIDAYHHWCCEFESQSGRGVQQYVIKFVIDLRQVGDFLWVFRFPPPIKVTATI